MKEKECVLKTVVLPKGVSCIKWMEEDQLHHVGIICLKDQDIGVVNTTDKKIEWNGLVGLGCIG